MGKPSTSKLPASNNMSMETIHTGWIRFEKGFKCKTTSKHKKRQCGCSPVTSTTELNGASKETTINSKHVAMENKIIKQIKKALKAQKIPENTEIIHFSSCQQDNGKSKRQLKHIYHTPCPKCPDIISAPFGSVSSIKFIPKSKREDAVVINLKGSSTPVFETYNGVIENPSTSTSCSDDPQPEMQTNFEHEIYIQGVATKPDGTKLIRNDCERWQNSLEEVATALLFEMPNDISQVVPESLLSPDYAEYLNLHGKDPLVECENKLIKDLLIYANDNTFGGKFEENSTIGDNRIVTFDKTTQNDASPNKYPNSKVEQLSNCLYANNGENSAKLTDPIEKFDNKAVDQKIGRKGFGKKLDNNAVAQMFNDNVVEKKFDNYAVSQNIGKDVAGKKFNSNVVSKKSNNKVSKMFDNEAVGNKFGNNAVSKNIDPNRVDNKAVGKKFDNNTASQKIGLNEVRKRLDNKAVGKKFGNNGIGKKIDNNAISQKLYNNAVSQKLDNNATGHKNTVSEKLYKKAVSQKFDNNAVNQESELTVDQGEYGLVIEESKIDEIGKSLQKTYTAKKKIEENSTNTGAHFNYLNDSAKRNSDCVGSVEKETRLSQKKPRQVIIDSTTKIPCDITEVIPACLLNPDYSEYLYSDTVKPLAECNDYFMQDLLIYSSGEVSFESSDD